MHRYGVVGNPVEHSKSPLIHGLFARQTHRHLSYDTLLLPTDNFEPGLKRLFADGLTGCNVTVPFKEQACATCHSLTERACIAMAVNTIVRQADGTLLGDNTDGKGLVTDLSKNNGIVLRASRILVAGAGGAARGIGKPLLDEEPASLVIANRNADKARALTDSFKAFGPIESQKYADLAGQRFDLIINATSASLANVVPPIPQSCVDDNTVVYDLMYARNRTVFLQWGLQLGSKRAIDGLGMLVEQAAEAFYLWEHIRPVTRDVIAQLRLG